MNKNKLIINYIIISFLILFIGLSIPANAADIEVIVDKLEVKQGGLIKVVIKSNTVDFTQDRYTGQFSWNKFYFYPFTENQLIAYIGASYWNETGKTTLKLKRNDIIFYQKNINIVPGDFKVSRIEVSKEKEELVKPDDENKKLQEKLERDKEKVKKARNNTASKKLWKNKFIWPLKGVISTDFGATRYVNGELQSRHSGIDIAADRGTSVKAANNGIVTLASNLTVTGKTIIIDHGQGIFSSYAHLSKMNVKAGEKIQKGDKIGDVGSTGFSTGPHLHWTIKVNGIYVDPEYFIKH